MSAVTKTSDKQLSSLLVSQKKLTHSTTSEGKEDLSSLSSKPKAKSKNPDFRAATLYLRKKTLIEAEYKLKRTEDRRDMSELAEELMAAWIVTPDA